MDHIYSENMMTDGTFSSLSPSSSSPPPPYGGSTPSSTAPSSPLSPLLLPPHVILSPCAACKILRRRCVEKCILAPYFPPTQPLKFTIAHKDLPESHREDSVNSLVYEANARIRDPVYGCAGAICHLQKQISDSSRTWLCRFLICNARTQIYCP
ncbi:hypothetical protein Leryth_027309 [Lithospermum erythrorhizon]|nr:hypothetical protein Leryth_027309 [Lithospermum erythrorhizon]